MELSVTERKIIHIDMDAFYASVELLDQPSLRGKPLAVGGRSGRGVLTTCSYEARQYGVRSAMPTVTARRLCPELIILPVRMARYRAISLQIREIFAHYCDRVEPLSLDEAYLDVSNSDWFSGSATLLARQIKQDILAQVGLTASAGVAPNRFLAKVASDYNKPDGLCVVTPAQAAAFAAELPLSSIPGVGPRTLVRLQSLGHHYARDLLPLSRRELEAAFGQFGLTLYERVRGIDRRSVTPDRTRKSVGVETTLAENLTSYGECLSALIALLPQLQQRLGQRHFHSLQVKLKFQDFQITTVSQRGNGFSHALLTAALQRAWARAAGRSVRLVGLSVTLSAEQAALQLSLPLSEEESGQDKSS